jgi:hypothetical protein
MRRNLHVVGEPSGHESVRADQGARAIGRRSSAADGLLFFVCGWRRDANVGASADL